MNKLIQKGNSKLVDMYMFNIPANKEVCGRECKGCYAIKEQNRYPSVTPARESRYQATFQPDFVSRIVKELNAVKTPFKYFRIHASGEFYSQLYIDNWYKIASKLPNITFYAYTKRLREFDFTALKSLPNVIVIDSFHYGGLNYGKKDKAPSNAFVCPHQKGASVVCGKDCTHCMQKSAQEIGVWFVQH